MIVVKQKGRTVKKKVVAQMKPDMGLMSTKCTKMEAIAATIKAYICHKSA